RFEVLRRSKSDANLQFELKISSIISVRKDYGHESRNGRGCHNIDGTPRYDMCGLTHRFRRFIYLSPLVCTRVLQTPDVWRLLIVSAGLAAPPAILNVYLYSLREYRILKELIDALDREQRDRSVLQRIEIYERILKTHEERAQLVAFYRGTVAAI